MGKCSEAKIVDFGSAFGHVHDVSSQATKVNGRACHADSNSSWRSSWRAEKANGCELAV